MSSSSLDQSVQLLPSSNENKYKKTALTAEEKPKVKNISSRFKINLSQLVSNVGKLR